MRPVTLEELQSQMKYGQHDVIEPRETDIVVEKEDELKKSLE